MDKAYKITTLVKDYNNFDIGLDGKLKLKGGYELINSRTGAPLFLNTIVSHGGINTMKN